MAHNLHNLTIAKQHPKAGRYVFDDTQTKVFKQKIVNSVHVTYITYLLLKCFLTDVWKVLIRIHERWCRRDIPFQDFKANQIEGLRCR